jgi:DnaJ-class molecular chaperone
MDGLFGCLPEQTRPRALECDSHFFVECRRCDGTGREVCTWPKHYMIAQTWDPTCRGCSGTGGTLERRWVVPAK